MFGGSFDPVHLAHLVVAERVAEALTVDRVLFVPAHRQPLKEAGPRASAADRLAMLRLATAGNPRFEVSAIELDRGGTSYTIDTLRALAELHPGADLSLVLGSDAFALLDRWREAGEIRRLARFVVVARPETGKAADREGGTVRRVHVPALAISASDIRRRVSEGHSVRYLVPEPVRGYIAERGLYR